MDQYVVDKMGRIVAAYPGIINLRRNHAIAEILRKYYRQSSSVGCVENRVEDANICYAIYDTGRDWKPVCIKDNNFDDYIAENLLPVNEEYKEENPNCCPFFTISATSVSKIGGLFTKQSGSVIAAEICEYLCSELNDKR